MATGDERTKTATLAEFDAGTGRWLLAFWEGGSARYLLPDEGPLNVGRGDSCEVRIEHPSVSRHHAIWRAGRPDTIEDKGSANGTKVNGRVLMAGERAHVGEGDVVEVGRAMLLLRPRQLQAPEGRASARPELGAQMNRVRRMVELAAPTTMSVLLLGETGVGKDVLADEIHRRSQRANADFVRVNCAALPATLLEAELFGHERGAFTGATQTKPGLLEAASGGTIFFDEIGELPLETQAKLLLVLERREVRRLGSVVAKPVDVRFVSATNRDLPALVATQQFRADLFFRINGVTIEIPPLRQRTGEIAALASEFIGDAGRELGKTLPTISEEALEWLRQQPWPGNIRELRTVMQRAVLFAERAIDVDTLLSCATSASPPAEQAGDLRSQMETLERTRILEALERCGGNQTKAAELLGMPRRTFVQRLSDYGVSRPRKRRA